MAETEIIATMLKRFLTFLAVILMPFVAVEAQDYSWESVPVDGRMTGCTSTSGDNVAEALGYFKGCRYVSPSGNTYRRNSPVARTARIVIDAQPKMKRVKTVIAHCPDGMAVAYPESPLSNWFVDNLMKAVEKEAGRPVHVGIVNFGGIRVDMPVGDVILDDLLSMFPFRNQIVYLEHRGSEIRKIVEEMAATKFQVLGGIRTVVEEGKVRSIEIGGEPLEDDMIYGVATISFLLYGGDDLHLADNAIDLKVYDRMIIDVMLEYVESETAAGRVLTSCSDDRVIIR